MSQAMIDLSLPTPLERTAHRLRETQGLSDEQIGRHLGVRRETANRYVRAYERKTSKLRVVCAGMSDCSLLAALTS